jgi:hypothetical protein
MSAPTTHAISLSVNEMKVIWFALQVVGIRAQIDRSSTQQVDALFERFSALIEKCAERDNYLARSAYYCITENCHATVSKKGIHCPDCSSPGAA